MSIELKGVNARTDEVEELYVKACYYLKMQDMGVKTAIPSYDNLNLKTSFLSPFLDKKLQEAEDCITNRDFDRIEAVFKRTMSPDIQFKDQIYKDILRVSMCENPLINFEILKSQIREMDVNIMHAVHKNTPSIEIPDEVKFPKEQGTMNLWIENEMTPVSAELKVEPECHLVVDIETGKPYVIGRAVEEDNRIHLKVFDLRNEQFMENVYKESLYGLIEYVPEIFVAKLKGTLLDTGFTVDKKLMEISTDMESVRQKFYTDHCEVSRKEYAALSMEGLIMNDIRLIAPEAMDKILKMMGIDDPDFDRGTKVEYVFHHMANNTQESQLYMYSRFKNWGEQTPQVEQQLDKMRTELKNKFNIFIDSSDDEQPKSRPAL